MATLSEIQTELAQLREIVASGIKTVTTDGTTTTFDLQVVRQRIRELEAQLPGGRANRPRAYRVNLG